MKKLFLALASLAAVVAVVALVAACSSKKNAETAAATEAAQKYLILYYSQTGATQTVANAIKSSLGDAADVEVIEVEEPYSGTYQETIERCQKEKADGTVPAVKPLKANLADYDAVFLGYPIWFGTYAQPIAGLVKSVDFAGKKIVPFCTFGSGGLVESIADLKKALPQAEILDGYGVRNARIAKAADEVGQFLIDNGYVAGQKSEPLPAFYEQTAVTDADKAVFEAACGDYPMPLGTPVTASKRTVPGGTEYMFKAKGNNGAMMTVYVTASDAEGAKPEFTMVVR